MELARVQVSRAEQEERVAYLRRVPPSAEKHVSPQLVELETKRAELLARYLPESKRIQEIDEEIRHLRSSPAVDTPAASPRADAGSELVAARAVLAALSGREKALAQGREEYRRRLVMLEAEGGELAPFAHAPDGEYLAGAEGDGVGADELPAVAPGGGQELLLQAL